MTIATLSRAEFDVGLLSALNLSLPKKQAKLRRILAKESAMQKVLGQLQQIFAQKTSLTSGKVPQGSSLPDGIAPPPGLALPPGLACPDFFKDGECAKKGVSETEDYVRSDAEDTSFGTGFTTRVSSETPDSEDETFHMNVAAPCFVPSSLNSAPRKVPSPYNAMGMTWSPLWACADQAQQGDHRWY